MRTIEKNEIPKTLSAWIDLCQEEPITCVYSNLAPDVKEDLKYNLIQEQRSLCAYCTQRVTFKHSHIEHLYPQSKDKGNRKGTQLNYANLVASCPGDREEDGVSGVPVGLDSQLHCGHKKENWYDDKLFVSPLTEEASAVFRFLKGGEISAAKGVTQALKKAAEVTIERLNLNCTSLVSQRDVAFNQTLKTVWNTINKVDSSKFSFVFEQYTARYSTPNSEGELPTFQPVMLAAVDFLKFRVAKSVA